MAQCPRCAGMDGENAGPCKCVCHMNFTGKVQELLNQNTEDPARNLYVCEMQYSEREHEAVCFEVVKDEDIQPLTALFCNDHCCHLYKATEEQRIAWRARQVS